MKFEIMYLSYITVQLVLHKMKLSVWKWHISLKDLTANSYSSQTFSTVTDEDKNYEKYNEN